MDQHAVPYIAVAFNLGMMIGQVPAGTLHGSGRHEVGLAAIFVAWRRSAPCTPGRSRHGHRHDLRRDLRRHPGLAGYHRRRPRRLHRLAVHDGPGQCGNYTAGIKALAGLFPAATGHGPAASSTPGRSSARSSRRRSWCSFGTFHVNGQWAFVIPALLGSLWLIPWLAIFPSKER